jgi:hypothetical protein
MLVGLLLALLTAYQASRFKQLGLQEAARDEARGLSETLRARLDLGRAMLDLNAASMRDALMDLGRWPHPLEWAGLYDAGGQPIASTAADPGGVPFPDNLHLQTLVPAAPEDLPWLRSLGGGRFLAVTRLQVGERELTMAMVLAPEGWRPGAAGLWSAMSTCLLGLAAAAVLLIWHGAADVLSRPPGAAGPAA